MWTPLFIGFLIGLCIATFCLVVAFVADRVVALFEDLGDIYNQYFRI